MNGALRAANRTVVAAHTIGEGIVGKGGDKADLNHAETPRTTSSTDIVLP